MAWREFIHYQVKIGEREKGDIDTDRKIRIDKAFVLINSTYVSVGVWTELLACVGVC